MTPVTVDEPITPVDVTPVAVSEVVQQQQPETTQEIEPESNKKSQTEYIVLSSKVSATVGV